MLESNTPCISTSINWRADYASYIAIPSDIYDAVIESCEYKNEESKDRPIWNLLLRITSDPDSTSYSGLKFYTQLSFAKCDLLTTKKVLQELNPALLDIPNFNPKNKMYTKRLVGLNVIVQIGNIRERPILDNNVHKLTLKGD